MLVELRNHSSYIEANEYRETKIIMEVLKLNLTLYFNNYFKIKIDLRDKSGHEGPYL